MTLSVNTILIAGSAPAKPTMQDGQAILQIEAAGGIVSVVIASPSIASHCLAEWEAGQRHFVIQAALAVSPDGLVVRVDDMRGHDVRSIAAPPKPIVLQMPAAASGPRPIPGRPSLGSSLGRPSPAPVKGPAKGIAALGRLKSGASPVIDESEYAEDDGAEIPRPASVRPDLPPPARQIGRIAGLRLAPGGSPVANKSKEWVERPPADDEEEIPF